MGAHSHKEKTMKRRHFAYAMPLVLSALLATVGLPSAAQADRPETLTIAAANSLKDVLRKILPLFESQHKNLNVRVVYGPSQTLREQIEQGSPVDVFLPSLFEEVEQLEQKKLVLKETTRIYAGTSLVLITATALPAPIGSIHDLERVPVRRVAIGNPATSSVGKVAAQFLKNTRLDQRLQSHYVYGAHSRAVLDLVASGEAEVGVVYRTDAVSNTKVRIIEATPSDSHTPVRYGLAIPWTAKNTTWAREFSDFLLTPHIQTILEEYGFDRVSSKVGLVKRQEGNR
jgi:molybdate transport system substrate-binding protein